MSQWLRTAWTRKSSPLVVAAAFLLALMASLRGVRPNSREGRSPHDADDFFITCFDHRCRKALHRFIDTTVHEADHCAFAGAAKSILDPTSQPLILGQIDIAARLHHIKTIHVVNHMDCGAYGGSGQHHGPAAEREFHRQQLAKAADIIQRQFPTLRVVIHLEVLDPRAAVEDLDTFAPLPQASRAHAPDQRTLTGVAQ